MSNVSLYLSFQLFIDYQQNKKARLRYFALENLKLLSAHSISLVSVYGTVKSLFCFPLSEFAIIKYL